MGFLFFWALIQNAQRYKACNSTTLSYYEINQPLRLENRWFLSDWQVQTIIIYGWWVICGRVNMATFLVKCEWDFPFRNHTYIEGLFSRSSVSKPPPKALRDALHDVRCPCRGCQLWAIVFASCQPNSHKTRISLFINFRFGKQLSLLLLFSSASTSIYNLLEYDRSWCEM